MNPNDYKRRPKSVKMVPRQAIMRVMEKFAAKEATAGCAYELAALLNRYDTKLKKGMKNV